MKSRDGTPIHVGDFVNVKGNWYGIVTDVHDPYVKVLPISTKWGTGHSLGCAARNVWPCKVPDWIAPKVMAYRLTGELL